MKSLLTFFLAIVVTFNLNGQGHKYIPFPDSNAIWVVKYLDEVGNIKNGRNYFIQKDTTIMGEDYNKVVYTIDSLLINIAFSWYGVRYDSLDRKVFMYDQGSQQEWMLYDFSLQAGDTVPDGWLGNARYAGSVITKIDTVLIDNKEHLVFYPTYDMESRAPFIEGIGSVSGLFESTYFFEGGAELVCLMLGKDRQPYFTYSTNVCQLYHYTGIDENSPDTKEEPVRVYPVPLEPSTVIKLTSPNDNIHSLMIFDGTGKAIYKNDGLGKSEFKIGHKIAKPGIYFYHITTRSGKILNGKLIK